MTVRFSYVRVALRVCSLPRNTDYDAVKYPIFLRATTYRDITSSTAVTPGENRCPVGVCCVTESINALPICEKRELHDCPINKSNGRTVGYAVLDTGLHRYHAMLLSYTVEVPLNRTKRGIQLFGCRLCRRRKYRLLTLGQTRGVSRVAT